MSDGWTRRSVPPPAVDLPESSGVRFVAPALAPTRVIVRSAADRQLAVHRARQLALTLGAGSVDRGAFETIVLELTQNLLDHGGGGEVTLRMTDEHALEVIARDQGPGITQLDAVLEGGVVPRAGLGEGVAAVRRLSHELRITSRPGDGTIVLARRWKTR